jgi:hypothetical protein
MVKLSEMTHKELCMQAIEEMKQFKFYHNNPMSWAERILKSPDKYPLISIKFAKIALKIKDE